MLKEMGRARSESLIQDERPGRGCANAHVATRFCYALVTKSFGPFEVVPPQA